MERTCGNCPNMQITGKPMYALASCCETNLVVPHGSEASGDGWDMTFWRIPDTCPRPDDEVVKSEGQADPKHWVHARESKK